MKYELDSGRTVNIPDKDLEKLQKSLNISLDEAIYTWLVDEDYVKDETVEELSEKAKKNRITATIHQAKSDNSQKKERKPREKKANPLKRQIIEEIFYGLARNLLDSDCINIRNAEKYIDFTIDGRDFTVNLVEHRPKK